MRERRVRKRGQNASHPEPTHFVGLQRAEWVPLRKGVAYLLRYREISLQAKGRCLDALAAVDDPRPGKQALQRLTTTKKDAAGHF